MCKSRMRVGLLWGLLLTGSMAAQWYSPLLSLGSQLVKNKKTIAYVIGGACASVLGYIGIKKFINNKVRAELEVRVKKEARLLISSAIKQRQKNATQETKEYKESSIVNIRLLGKTYQFTVEVRLAGLVTYAKIDLDNKLFTTVLG